MRGCVVQGGGFVVVNILIQGVGLVGRCGVPSDRLLRLALVSFACAGYWTFEGM